MITVGDLGERHHSFKKELIGPQIEVLNYKFSGVNALAKGEPAVESFSPFCLYLLI